MATVSPTADTQPRSTGPRTPRIIFFGPPNSGKSWLLKYFIRTAAPQDDTLTLVPAPASNQVGREIVPHEIEVQNPNVGNVGSRFTLYDCDGKAAGNLLNTPQSVLGRTSRGVLVNEIRNADALLLIIDANATPNVIEQTLDNFRAFVQYLRADRENEREVGGLPVFATLTKCDELYSPGDSLTDWLSRLHDRQSRIEDRFQDYFGDDAVQTESEQQFFNFGSIELFLHATSTRIPPGPAFHAYADATTEAFGVEKLVTACLQAASAHLDRTTRARKRLGWTVGGAGGLLGMMIFGVMLFLATGGFGSANLLTERVRAYQTAEPTAAVRFADKHFGRYFKELNSIHASAGFTELPKDLQQFVNTRLAEFEQYKSYRSLFKPPRLGPAELRTREQVDQLNLELSNAMAPPKEFVEAWKETEAVQLWSKWKTDLELAREAEDRLHDWYRGLIRRANELLLTEKPPDFSWRTSSMTVIKDADSPPFRPDAEIEKSPSVPVLRGRKLTYGVAFSSERVSIARRDWEDSRDRLRCLRDLTDAIGMTTGPGTPNPVLDLPEPTFDGIGSADLATKRLSELAVAFPARPAERNSTSLARAMFPEWIESGYPDLVRQFVDVRLRSIQETARRHVGRIIALNLSTTGDNRDGWQRIANDVLTQPTIQGWDRLLMLLQELTDREAKPSPIRDMQTFLKQERSDLYIPSLVLSLPDDLLGQRALPSGNFVLTVQPAGQQPKTYSFKLVGEGQRNRPFTLYTFQPDGHDGRIALAPGESLLAAVPLRSDGQDYRLVWASGRSNWFQLDRLQQPPRLEKIGLVPAPQTAANVKLSVPDPGVFPRVPALVPDLRVK